MKRILNTKKTICIDFDGVIYPNIKYLGVDIIKGNPIDNVKESLDILSKDYNIVIHSARCEDDKGYESIVKWLKENDLNYQVVKNKPTAFIYLDDRGVTFNGDWNKAIQDIKQFKQWQTDIKLKNKIVTKKFKRR